MTKWIYPTGSGLRPSLLWSIATLYNVARSQTDNTWLPGHISYLISPTCTALARSEYTQLTGLTINTHRPVSQWVSQSEWVSSVDDQSNFRHYIHVLEPIYGQSSITVKMLSVTGIQALYCTNVCVLRISLFANKNPSQIRIQSCEETTGRTILIGRWDTCSARLTPKQDTQLVCNWPIL